MTFNAQRDQKAKYFDPVISDEPMTAHQLARALLKMPDRRVEMDTASDGAFIDVMKVYAQGDVVVIDCGEDDEEEDE